MQADFPQEIIAKGNQLAPFMFAARRTEMKAFLVADRLIIDRRSYTVVDTIYKLPEALYILRLGIRSVIQLLPSLDHSHHFQTSTLPGSPYTECKNLG